MTRVPLISSETTLDSAVESIVRRSAATPPTILRLRDATHAIDLLNLELPELVFMHFPDRCIDGFGLLETMMGDPWLIHAGIVALCDDEKTAERLESIRGTNLIVTLEPQNLDCQLPRVLDILRENRRLLFQREIGAIGVREISGLGRLHNDRVEARCYANLICNYLFNSNRIDDETRHGLKRTLQELLFNAIERGIGSPDELNRQRRVTFEYTIEPARSSFRIVAEGSGFDWGKMPEVTKRLTHNESGNELRFEIDHKIDEASMTPAPFSEMAARNFSAGQSVFTEGEPSDFMYYIVNGRYDVSVGGRSIATLSPDDILVGEMSFLLNDRRGATVSACAPGRLIEISKRDFVRAVRSHPHYALLLSRILAQRIERANLLRSAAREPGATRHPDSPTDH